jgi:hypothetical protein
MPAFSRPAMQMQRPQFRHVTGTIIDSQKRYQGYGGGIPATLHHEVWIKEPNGTESHVHLVDDDVPMRKGQSLEVIFFENRPVGLINYTTNKYINFEPYAYTPIPDYVTGFPDLTSMRDIGLVIFVMIIVGLLFERKPIVAVLFFFVIVGVVIYRNKQPEPSPPVRNDFHDLVEAEIKFTMSAKLSAT